MLKKILLLLNGSKQYNPLRKFNFGSVFMSKNEYLKECENTFETLLEQVEGLDPENNFDINYSDGVVSISIKDSTFVINRQTPNEQIWYSSPISGPARFDFNKIDKKWYNSRSEDLENLLIKEITKVKCK